MLTVEAPGVDPDRVAEAWEAAITVFERAQVDPWQAAAAAFVIEGTDMPGQEDVDLPPGIFDLADAWIEAAWVVRQIAGNRAEMGVDPAD